MTDLRATAPIAPTPAASAPRPRVRVGDAWRFAVRNRLTGSSSEETRRVLALTRERIACEVDSTDPAFARGRFVYTRQWNLVSRPALGSPGDAPEDVGQWRWKPPYPQFRFPLAPGKQWRGTARVTNGATDTTNVHRYVARVLDPQTITVPAGTLAVLPVRYEAEVTTEGDDPPRVWRNAETLHYAAAVNLFVRAEYGVTGPDGTVARDALHELLAYTRGPSVA